MVWNCDTMTPNFWNYDNDILPLHDMIFKRDRLFKNYKKLVKPEEDFDTFKNKGYYELNKEDFNQCILFNMSKPIVDDGMLQNLLDSIPNEQQFKRVYILPEKK